MKFEVNSFMCAYSDSYEVISYLYMSIIEVAFIFPFTNTSISRLSYEIMRFLVYLSYICPTQIINLKLDQFNYCRITKIRMGTYSFFRTENESDIREFIRLPSFFSLF
jgi:hypothetical protein